MGCLASKPAREAADGDERTKPPDAEDQRAKEVSVMGEAPTRLAVDAAELDVSVTRRQLESASGRHHGGFRHTSGLRVGVIESKETSVTLLNDYIVLGALGKGAYGSVKLCYSMRDDGLYALKVLQKAQLKRQALGPRRGAAAAAPALDMLRREVDVMRSMNHPNLIKIFEVIEAESKVVLVQEYAEAGPLQQPDSVMSEPLAQYYFRQIVAGLDCLHAQAVVHGDMKPDNVLLSGSGLVKIADFGQAQFFNEGADVFDKTLGTPAFMAPEMRSGGAYHGKPADMWALGVTLYCFVFGDLPFKAPSLEELYEAIQTQEVRYPPHIPISDALRAVLGRLLNKDPAGRPTAAALLHDPWVVEADDELGRPSESPQLDRMDDAPSLEKWTDELAAEEAAAGAVPRLEVATEVAATVFGRDILANAASLNTRTIMGVMLESNTDTSAFPTLSVLLTPGRTGAGGTPATPSTRGDATPGLRPSQSSALAAAWGGAQAAAAIAEPSGAVLEANGGGVRGLELGPAQGGGQSSGFSDAASMLAPSDRASTEQLAAALDGLLGHLSMDEPDLAAAAAVAAAAPAPAPRRAANGAAPPGGGGEQPPPAPVRVVRCQPAAGQEPGSAGGASSTTTPFAEAALRPLASAGPSGDDRSPALSIPAAGRPSLPISPFESTHNGSVADLPAQSPLSHHLSLSLGAAAAAPRAAPARAAAGQRLQTTAEVWDEMRAKAIRNNAPGVRFVSFPAGQPIDFPPTAAGNYCLLIESGIIDARYVAALPFKLSQTSAAAPSQARRGAGAATPGPGSDDSDDEERRLERRDSVARGPEARAFAPSRKQHGELAPSPSLQDTVDRVLARAQRVLATATDNSETNMLTAVRGPNDFVGVSALLEPVQTKKLYSRWKVFLSARTEVRGVALSRTGLELVLKHYPLSQVYLRLTLSKGRAEILQLESLENIASCLKPSPAPSAARRGPAAAPGVSTSRLDLFRAVSFARKLAATMADQVTNLDPLADAQAAAGALGGAAARVPRLFDGLAAAAEAAAEPGAPTGRKLSGTGMPPLLRKSMAALARVSARPRPSVDGSSAALDSAAL